MIFITALRHDRISVPWVINSSINGEFEQVLAPTPRKGADSSSSTISAAIKARRRGAPSAPQERILFQPRYSPT
ncbi:hypothetical protein [Bradyrhizobium sp. RDT46]|uniref:hypothetical protein n=1 Tax=Bradyrhizobium sp. RDT46 TaxID=3341829 RepID=UPI0035C69E28